jgi:hypothetical protein
MHINSNRKAILPDAHRFAEVCTMKFGDLIPYRPLTVQLPRPNVSAVK